MRSNNKYTAVELERYIEMYLDDRVSYKELRNNYRLLLSESAFGQKVLRYQTYGLKGIQPKSVNNRYSQAFKLSVIEEHLSEEIPIKN